MDLKNLRSEKSEAGVLTRLAVKLVILIAVAVLLTAVFAMTIKVKNSSVDESVMQGSVKTTEIDLNSMISGFILDIAVEEGQEVKAGDVIMTLEADIVQAQADQAGANIGQAEAAIAQARAKVTEAQAAKAQAEATRAAAQAQLNKALGGARNEDLQTAKAAFDYATKTYERMKSLYEQDVISASDFDGVEYQYQTAKNTYEKACNGAQSEDIDAARAQVRQAEAAVMQYEGAIQEAQAAVMQYQATLDQANAGVDQADAYLEKTVITAPSDGVVAAVNVEKGELISTGMALATLRADSDAWIEVNVRETSLSYVKEGAPVKLSFPAYKDTDFTGTVSFVSKNPDFATKKATNENGSFDVLSYKVKIKIDDMKEPLYSGMTVFVDFDEDGK